MELIASIISKPFELNSENEMNMLKTALLYADKVEVCSPMIQPLVKGFGLSQSTNITSDEERLLGLILNDQSLCPSEYVNPMFPEYDGIREVLLKLQNCQGKDCLTVNEIKKAKDLFTSYSEKIINSNLYKISELEEKGILTTIDIFGEFNIANYIEIASDPQKYQIKDIEVKTKYLEYIYKALFEPNRFPLIDPEFYKSDSNKTVSKRQKEVDIAQKILFMLPTIQSAELDQIIDIREEFGLSLRNFRREIMFIADQVSSMPYDNEYDEEVVSMFRKQIEPKCDEIKEKIISNKYLSRVFDNVTSNPVGKTGTCIGIAVGLGQVNIPFLASFLGSLAVGTIAQGVKEVWNANKEIKKHSMYFSYFNKK